ncbi:SIMPL domain-containing protein [Crenothrix sp.]|uniref:SIMPL domain-containing protein n=1 Tax=Crenothrix sp. TaxID=3100433 RepID=UPI00374C8A62
MEKQLPYSMAVLGLLLALGMSGAAFILGVQAKKAVSAQQSVSVKGLAEKAVQADNAEWTVTVSVTAETFSDALAKLRQERPGLDTFLIEHGLDKTSWQEGAESVTPHMIDIPLPNGGTRSEQRGYDASQNIVVTSKDLVKVTAANKDILSVQATGKPFTASAPLYLVSNLEDVKMSLIGDATENARNRAKEFVKHDGVKVGVMRSASQGAFYILPPGGTSDGDDYGGTYDKTTINKTAKVVVTIVYNIEQ